MYGTLREINYVCLVTGEISETRSTFSAQLHFEHLRTMFAARTIGPFLRSIKAAPSLAVVNDLQLRALGPLVQGHR